LPCPLFLCFQIYLANMYTYGYDTSLGRVFITASDDNVKCVSIGKNSFVDAVYTETTLIRKAYTQLCEYLEGRRKRFELPLSPDGTDFQKKVWNELMNIPYGETATYGEIAKRIGNPNASRAVGNANNKNPIPIFIPCHRVIGVNGKLVGYAYGLDMKRTLLDLEKSL